MMSDDEYLSCRVVDIFKIVRSNLHFSFLEDLRVLSVVCGVFMMYLLYPHGNISVRKYVECGIHKKYLLFFHTIWKK